MLRFENLDFFWAFAIIPLILLAFLYARYLNSRALKKIGDKNLIGNLIPNRSTYKAWLKLGIYLLSFSSLIIALANPQIGTKMQEVKREGIEIIFAIDVSNSMMAEDIKPSRIERAKQSLNNFIDKLYSDKIGLILFAGESFLQLPLTTDYSAAKLLNSTVSTDMIAAQGTAIGASIQLAMETFSEDDVNKVLIIITDGENHEDDALGMAQKAAEEGIIINTIGMGSPDGGPIPIYIGNQRVNFHKDKSGKTVITKLNATMLQQLAGAGGGSFVRASNSKLDLESLIKNVSDIEKTEFETKKFTEYEDRFQYFLAFSLLLLFLESFISDKRMNLFSRISDFIGGKS